MTKRIVPYGYAIEDGRYTLEAEEAAVVQQRSANHWHLRSEAHVHQQSDHLGESDLPDRADRWWRGLSSRIYLPDMGRRAQDRKPGSQQGGQLWQLVWLHLPAARHQRQGQRYRLSICQDHEIPYTMLVFEFEDALKAKQWALDTQKGRRNLDNWELGKIALKLKPDVEARARMNQSIAGGDKTTGALSATLPEALPAVDTRKELAKAVGLGERTMGKVMQIDENAPAPVKEALDNKELSINQGYNLTRQLQQVPEEQREDAAQDALKKLRKEVQEKDAEIDRKAKIARRFCAAYEKVNLLEVSEDNIRIWVDCTRMKPDEIADAAEESYRHSEMFREIGNILKNTVLPEDWRNANENSEESGG